MKAIKNFKCNGVKKMAGQCLSKKEMDLIGDKMLEELQSNDLVMKEKVQEKTKEKSKEMPAKKVIKKEEPKKL